jgi:hypothetical protein
MQHKLDIDIRIKEFIRQACRVMKSMLAHSGCQAHFMFADTTEMISRAFEFDNCEDRKHFLREILLLEDPNRPGEFDEIAYHNAACSESFGDALEDLDWDLDWSSDEDMAANPASQ